MKTTDKTAATTSTPSQLDAIETAALDDVTGACGQACANGPAPAAAGGSRFPARFAALSSFARR
jgi:hypothetical protein